MVLVVAIVFMPILACAGFIYDVIQDRRKGLDHELVTEWLYPLCGILLMIFAMVAFAAG